ncbi:D-arabinono-1,4-lactone oxidase [Alicyclobacillus mengziensis]|uniref:FAD-binding protein n=1 Tax=Alicyclobacillus mengziensis TaxID=2931921 RepID=A0A9X7Z809_9BACL|nr:D-arabinono-1,4-lactone oxidase [Alicyclobacillus mengziensis]QSO49684.1 FAD-binding protein [Alicyclobacillus mengziensis]
MQTVQPQHWNNWSGLVRSTPQKVVYPASIEDVVAVVTECRRHHKSLRVVGAGHSFTPLAATDDVLMSLDNLSGLIEVHSSDKTALAWAGTRLHELGPLLWQNGLAMENLGDIDTQSIAGAISTGTHGTGGQYGVLATQVLEITAVLGTGEVVTCSEAANRELFRALQVSLGALGVIVKVKLQCTKAFRLRYESRRVKLEDCLGNLDSYRNDYRHFEFYCFPYSDTCQVKLMSETAAPVTHHPVRDYFNNVIVENWAFGALSFACRSVPRLCRPVSRFSASNVPVGSEIGKSYEVFATPRLVKFNEMEYNIPAQELPAVVREVLERIEQQEIPVHFPIECRYVRGDNIPISPASERDSAYVAVHMYKGMPHEGYFRAMEEIFLRHQGRPHWGKLHYLTASNLAEKYPKWQYFLDVRRKADPDGVLVNPYLRTLFGIETGGQFEPASRSDESNTARRDSVAGSTATGSSSTIDSKAECTEPEGGQQP